MREAGAYLTTSECMLLGLCGDAAHPKFKPIQKLITESAPDTGLLNTSIKGETTLWNIDINNNDFMPDVPFDTE